MLASNQIPSSGPVANTPSHPNPALDTLLPHVYDELRRIASVYLRREPLGHILETTALLHEAYVRLARSDGADALPRAQFFAAAANTVRRVLIDHARARGRQKRGGDALQVNLDLAAIEAPASDFDLLELDAALEQLAALDARRARVVELRFFGGLTEAEVAESLDVSRRTVVEDWRAARAWLHRRLVGNSAAAREDGA